MLSWLFTLLFGPPPVHPYPKNAGKLFVRTGDHLFLYDADEYGLTDEELAYIHDYFNWPEHIRQARLSGDLHLVAGATYEAKQWYLANRHNPRIRASVADYAETLDPVEFARQSRGSWE
jgi:hypothetical protein